ncbi:hypothetical protein AU196_16005 [Mycobacterium sp. IS-1742]|nr:hypothetical protein AU196_16005 [Mycobacterium sp. IS-1742]
MTESEILRSAPVLRLGRRAEHRQRDVVACAVTHLLDASGELFDGQRVGDPSGVVPDDPLDRRIGVAADVDRWMRFLHRFRAAERRFEVDVPPVVLGGFVGPQRLDGLDALVEQGTAGLRVRAVVAQFLDVPAGADTEHETAAGDQVDTGPFLGGDDGIALDEKCDARDQLDVPGDRRGGGERDERVQRAVVDRGQVPAFRVR